MAPTVKKKTAKGGTNESDQQDMLEAQQGAALLAEAMMSFREPSVEPPQFSARTVLKNVREGRGLPVEYQTSRSAVAGTIYLRGQLPTEENAFCVGKYTRQNELLAGRHVYQSVDGSRSMWYALPEGEYSGGSWYVGPSDVKGQRTGYLKVLENTDIPEEITKLWSVYSGGEWHEAPLLKVHTEEEHESIVSAALAGGAQRVQLTGEMPDGFDTSGFGILSQSERLDERHVYRGEGLALWWVDKAWFVGEAADVGTHSSFVMVPDEAHLPEGATAAWKAPTATPFGPGWADVPGIKLVVV